MILEKSLLLLLVVMVIKSGFSCVFLTVIIIVVVQRKDNCIWLFTDSGVAEAVGGKVVVDSVVKFGGVVGDLFDIVYGKVGLLNFVPQRLIELSCFIGKV